MLVDSYCHIVKCTVIEVGVQCCRNTEEGEIVLVEFILLIRVSRPVCSVESICRFSAVERRPLFNLLSLCLCPL